MTTTRVTFPSPDHMVVTTYAAEEEHGLVAWIPAPKSDPIARAMVVGQPRIDDIEPDGSRCVLEFDAPASDLAAIVPFDPRRPRRIRTRQWFTAELHNRGLVINYDSGPSPRSRKFAELKRDGAIIARDPMPTIMVLDAERRMVPMPVEIPGPNCLDALSTALGLTDEEREAFGTRREDAALMLAQASAESREELETPS